MCMVVDADPGDLMMDDSLTFSFSTGGSPGKADHSYKKLTAGGGHDLMLAEEGIQMTSIVGNNPPAWVNDVQGVEGCLIEIHNRMDQLKSMHAQRVGSVFGKDLDNMEGRIERYTQELTDQFRYAERLLQKVGMATRRVGGEEATVGANVQRRYVWSCYVEVVVKNHDFFSHT